MSKHYLTLISVFTLMPAAAQTAPVLVGRLGPDGQVAFETFEVFTINGRDSVRVLPESQPAIDERAYGRLARVRLSQSGIWRREGNSVVQLPPSSDVKRAIILPDQARPKAAQKLEEFWIDVAFAGKRNRKDTDETVFGLQEFFALIPGGTPDAAVGFVLNPSYFENLDERLLVIRGVVNSFPRAPELEPLQEHLDYELRSGLESFDAGGPYANLLETLRVADTAETTFPESKRIVEDGRVLRERKAWVDSTVIALESLYNSGRWDDFLEKYRAFERYQFSFPRLVRLHQRAFHESARLHVRRGRQLAAQKNYPDAMKEFRLALHRDPMNRPLQDLSEEKRIEGSLAIARQKAAGRNSLAKDSPEEVRFTRHLSYATRYIADQKLAEAEQEIAAATELARESPRLMLVRAKLLAARSELRQALAVLNRYDETAVNAEERRLGEELRVEVVYDFNKRKADDLAALSRLYAEGRFSEALALAGRSLELDPEDPEFLYYSGALSAILQNNTAGTERLQAFLKVSDSLAGDPKRRNLAYRVLTEIQQPRTSAATGVPNWFSGRKLGTEIYYCPGSLAFQVKVAAIRAGKQEQTFNWTADGALKSIASKFDDERSLREYVARMTAAGLAAPAGGAAPGTYFLEYFPSTVQVARIAERNIEGAAPLGTAGVVATRSNNGELEIGFAGPGAKPEPAFRHITLDNSPAVNPRVVEILEGPALIGFAPNPYFNPFVWTGLHQFRLRYDPAGRVESAAEIGAPRIARFAWKGNRLQSVVVYSTEGGMERSVYRRTLSYGGDKLVSETIEHGGKEYKILYRYVGDKLSEAVVEDPAALDVGERRARFL